MSPAHESLFDQLKDVMRGHPLHLFQLPTELITETLGGEDIVELDEGSIGTGFKANEANLFST